MKDFLYNLAKRALKVETEVKPRLPSFFEPAAQVPTVGFAGRDLFGDELPDVRIGDEQLYDSTVLDSSKSQARSARPGTPAGQLNREEGTGLLISLPEEHRRSDRNDRTDLFAHDTQSGSETAPPLHSSILPAGHYENEIDETRSGVMISKPDRKRPSEHDDVLSDARHDSSEARDENRSVPQVQRDPSLLPTRIHRPEPVEEIHERLGLADSNSVVSPQALTYSPPQPSKVPFERPQITKDPPVTENVINVTIGRIEVRATVAPPKSKSNDRVPPVTSLEDYLRQRSRTDRGGAA